MKLWWQRKSAMLGPNCGFEFGPRIGTVIRLMTDINDNKWLHVVCWYTTMQGCTVKRKLMLSYRYAAVPFVPAISVPVFVFGTAWAVLA